MRKEYSDEREPLNTMNMLEDGFFSNLGKTPPPKRKETTQIEIIKETPKYNTENVLLSLFDARDSLIDTYSKIGIGAYSQGFIDNINKIGMCIRAMGGDVDNFDPFTNMSGLQAPNISKNAKRVIENTIELYNIGQIDDAKVSEGGKAIILSFIGKSADIYYKAVGTLIPNKTWTGSEAIDFIYSPGEGRMSVKSFSDDGKWVDKSENYQISWELFESKVDFNVMPTEGKNDYVKKEGKKDSNIEIKEEANDINANNIDEDISDNFPIEEN